MFTESGRVRRAEQQLLAMFAIILSRIQGRVPGSGVLYLGRDCSLTTVRFGGYLRAAEDLIRDVERMQRTEKPPKLLLNDHCRICEFRERCHAQAVMEDNLSLYADSEKDDQEVCQEGSTHADPTRSHVSTPSARQAIRSAACCAIMRSMRWRLR
jgi:predicted RecB family nuclease